MILYKYYPCNRNSFLSLSVNGLWCSEYTKMNDPFECLGNLKRSFSKAEIKKFKEILIKSGDSRYNRLNLLNEEKMISLVNELRNKPLEKYAFCAFSEDPNNILMWTHYANTHSGIVIGFEFPELKGNNNLQKVNYENELKQIDLEFYAKFLIGNDDEYLNEILSDYSTKSTDWEYEKEWRLWRNKKGYFKYKPENIKEVHFGLNTSIETKAIILRLLHFLPNEFNIEEKEMTYEPLGIK